MKPPALFSLALAILVAVAGCASVTPEQARITRLFPMAEESALAALERAAISAGYVKTAVGEFQRTTLTRRDPILGVVEVSKQMDQGLGFTVATEERGQKTLVHVQPLVIIRVPFSKADYTRSPARPGSADHAEILNLIENALAGAQS